jgi:hypothetical protein
VLSVVCSRLLCEKEDLDPFFFRVDLGDVKMWELGDRMQRVRTLQIFQRTSLPSSGLFTGIAFLVLLMASTTKS